MLLATSSLHPSKADISPLEFHSTYGAAHTAAAKVLAVGTSHMTLSELRSALASLKAGLDLKEAELGRVMGTSFKNEMCVVEKEILRRPL